MHLCVDAARHGTDDCHTQLPCIAKILRVDKKPPKSKGVEFNMEQQFSDGCAAQYKRCGPFASEKLNDTILDHDTEKVRVMVKRGILKSVSGPEKDTIQGSPDDFKKFQGFAQQVPWIYIIPH